MPTNCLVKNLQCVSAIIVRGLQGSDRVEEHAQRLGGVRTTFHMPLLLAAVGLREQPTHELDEHRYRIIGELLAEFDCLSHDQSVTATCVEVVGQPCWRGVAFADHLIPTSRRYARLKFRVDLQRPQECNPFSQSDQIGCTRRFWRRSQPMKARLPDCWVNLQKTVEVL
jgi:hypothetical protein